MGSFLLQCRIAHGIRNNNDSDCNDSERDSDSFGSNANGKDQYIY